MQNSPIFILWDHSWLWGLMAFRALRYMGINCALVKANDIAQGCLFRKCPSAFLAPGGSARQKALSLGADGIREIRAWVRDGGFYMGFCGGAGLALTQPEHGLDLCPWQRHAYSERLYHMLSGHLYCQTQKGAMLLPVWWPGRFEPNDNPEISILANYLEFGPDLWLADLPVAEIPPHIWEDWQAKGALEQTLAMPGRQPLIIAGHYGKGAYMLSYAHLETPASPQANELLCWITRHFAGINPASSHVPQWTPLAEDNRRKFGFTNSFKKLLATAEKLNFLFRRAPWLYGWHGRTNGMVLNHMQAMLDFLCGIFELAELDKTREFTRLAALIDLFTNKAEAYLWNRKLHLAQTHLGKNSRLDNSQENKIAIFGHPMSGGGLAQQILYLLEELIFKGQARMDSQ